MIHGVFSRDRSLAVLSCRYMYKKIVREGRKELREKWEGQIEEEKGITN